MTKKILVIDDEPDILKLAIIRLEACGYEVLLAENGEKALEVLKGTTPDLILLDLLLPKMQGDALCKKLKSDPKTKKIPIVLFTASAVRVPSKVGEIGADDYIVKPFEPGELLFKIKRFVG